MDIKFRVFFLSYLDFFFSLVRILSASAVLFRTFHSHDVSLPGKNEQKKTLEQYCFSSQSSCSLYTEPVAPVTPTSHMILSLSLCLCVRPGCGLGAYSLIHMRSCFLSSPFVLLL